MRKTLRKVSLGRAREVWFARGGDIARLGPFATQVEASAHVMVHDPCCVVHQAPHVDCNCALRPIDGAFVWPEKRR